MPAMGSNVLVAHFHHGSLALISIGQDTGFQISLLVTHLESLLAYLSGFLKWDSWLLLSISLISFNHFSCSFLPLFCNLSYRVYVNYFYSCSHLKYYFLWDGIIVIYDYFVEAEFWNSWGPSSGKSLNSKHMMKNNVVWRVRIIDVCCWIIRYTLSRKWVLSSYNSPRHPIIH